MSTIYDRPDLYALAFEHRDFDAEVAFLLEAAALYDPQPIRRVLELAAGHAPHAGPLSSRRIDYVGLELHEKMLAAARSRWDGDDRIEIRHGDMNRFTLEKPVDLAFVMLGSLYYQTTQELLAHFDSVADAIRPGGLYIMDSCVQFDDPLRHGPILESTHLTALGEVHSRIWIELVDASTQRYREEWQIGLLTPDGEHLEATSIEYNNALYPQEFRLLIEQHGKFEIAAMYGSWSLENPIRPGSAITRPVIILRKRQSRSDQSA